MSEALEISLCDDHLVTPPIIDSLHRDSARRIWVLCFIPEPKVSTHEKEQVVIPFTSSEGRRITERMQRLTELFGRQIDRIYHGGGGCFSFFLNQRKAGDQATLRRGRDFSSKAYGELKDIAMNAQNAFLVSRRLKTR